MEPELTSGLTGISQKTQGKTTKGQCGSEQGQGLMCPQPTVEQTLKKPHSTANADPQENVQSKRAISNRKSPS